MRKFSDYYGKNAVNVKNGECYGAVLGVTLREGSKKIGGLFIEGENGRYEVPFSLVTGVGEKVITLKSEPEMTEERWVKLIGASVVNREGRDLGTVREAIIKKRSLVIERIEAGKPYCSRAIKAVGRSYVVVEVEEERAVTVFPASEKYLVGKRVGRTVFLSSGAVLIKEGEEITRRTVNEASLNGKITELTYAVCRRSSKIT